MSDYKNNKKHSEIVSALTLNMRFGLADDGLHSWSYRKKAYPLLFKTFHADFISLQEANDFQIDFLETILPEYRFIGKHSPAPPFWQNNIIFFKKTWECIYDELFFLSPTPTIPSRLRKSQWPRQCTIGMFKNLNRKIIIINTHFDFEESVQLESSGFIMERLSKLPLDVPAILSGDFNASPASASHSLFTGQYEDAKIKGPFFKDIFAGAFPCTFHKFSGNTNGEYIDWILYRGNILLKACRVIRNTFAGYYPSDHFPVYAEFMLDKK